MECDATLLYEASKYDCLQVQTEEWDEYLCRPVGFKNYYMIKIRYQYYLLLKE